MQCLHLREVSNLAVCDKFLNAAACSIVAHKFSGDIVIEDHNTAAAQLLKVNAHARLRWVQSFDLLYANRRYDFADNDDDEPPTAFNPTDHFEQHPIDEQNHEAFMAILSRKHLRSLKLHVPPYVSPALILLIRTTFTSAARDFERLEFLELDMQERSVVDTSEEGTTTVCSLFRIVQ
jgi:hypothetical protein